MSLNPGVEITLFVKYDVRVGFSVMPIKINPVQYKFHPLTSFDALAGNLNDGSDLRINCSTYLIVSLTVVSFSSLLKNSKKCPQFP